MYRFKEFERNRINIKMMRDLFDRIYFQVNFIHIIYIQIFKWLVFGLFSVPSSQVLFLLLYYIRSRFLISINYCELWLWQRFRILFRFNVFQRNQNPFPIFHYYQLLLLYRRWYFLLNPSYDAMSMYWMIPSKL